MHCESCEEKPKLVNIAEITGESPHTYDFDEEGKLFKICPNCFTADSLSLKGTRELSKSILENQSGYSRRDKKAVCTIICNTRRLYGEERKIRMSTIINSVKFATDRDSEKKLAKFFDVKLVKIQMLFYNVKVYRMLK